MSRASREARPYTSATQATTLLCELPHGIDCFSLIFRYLLQDLRTPAPANAKELKSARKEKRSCEGAPKSGSASAKRQKASAAAATPPKGQQTLPKPARLCMHKAPLFSHPPSQTSCTLASPVKHVSPCYRPKGGMHSFTNA